MLFVILSCSLIITDSSVALDDSVSSLSTEFLKAETESIQHSKNDESETKDLYKSNPTKVKELQALMNKAHVDSPVFKLRK